VVIRILTGKDVAGAVRYNEKKVGEGMAQRIGVVNYPNELLAEKQADFRLQLLEQQARLNPGIQKPSVHLAIAFHPTERVSDSQLQVIGKEVMKEAGFGQQPYLMYRHNDTLHPHMHIVSVSIGPDGRKISDQFIKRRLNKIRRGVEQRYNLVKAEEVSKTKLDIPGRSVDMNLERYQATVEELVKQATETYSFGSIKSFLEYLRLKNVQVNLAMGRSKSGITFQILQDDKPMNRPIRASDLRCRPTYSNLMNRFKADAEQHKNKCGEMITSINQRLGWYEKITEQDYMATLRQIGIEVLSRGGEYLYVQERSGVVIQEAELPDRFRQQELLKWFSDRTVRAQLSQPVIVIQKQEKSPISVKKPSTSVELTEKIEQRSQLIRQTVLRESPAYNPTSMDGSSNNAIDRSKQSKSKHSLSETEQVKSHTDDAKKLKKSRRSKNLRI
jgi:hypothetical protein